MAMEQNGDTQTVHVGPVADAWRPREPIFPPHWWGDLRVPRVGVPRRCWIGLLVLMGTALGVIAAMYVFVLLLVTSCNQEQAEADRKTNAGVVARLKRAEVKVSESQSQTIGGWCSNDTFLRLDRKAIDRLVAIKWIARKTEYDSKVSKPSDNETDSAQWRRLGAASGTRLKAFQIANKVTFDPQGLDSTYRILYWDPISGAACINQNSCD